MKRRNEKLNDGLVNKKGSGKDEISTIRNTIFDTTPHSLQFDSDSSMKSCQTTKMASLFSLQLDILH
jgi:hypothetical protein